MFDYKQRPTSEEYRDNWDRIFRDADELIEELDKEITEVDSIEYGELHNSGSD